MTDGSAPADVAIVDATVVTMDAAGTVHHGATVLVHGDTITAIRPSGEAAALATRVIDAGGGIVVPGLINAHTHLAMTMFRGLADDLDLDGFLARLLPAEGALLSPTTVAAGTRLAVAECLRAGVTTALDMYFFPEAATAVAADAGFDLRGGPVFVEFAGPDRRLFDDRMAWAADLLAATPAERRWVCPHSTYLLSEPQLRRVGELAATHGCRVHVHAAETVTEMAAVAARHGRGPIEVLRDTGLLGPGTVLAHGIHLDDHDIDVVASSGAAVAHCPASNLKLASGFARIPDLHAAGVPVALGTDGAASANDLDPWLAMRLAAYPLTARHGVGSVTAADVLAMATTAGARAAGDPSIGSIEVGTRADLVVLDASSPALTPSYDAVSTAVYAASRGDVRWVVAGGRVVVDDRVLTTIDVGAAIAEVAALQADDLGHGDGRDVNVAEARAAVHGACLRMVADGLVIGSAGNVSARVDEHHFVVSAAGVPYGELTPTDHPLVDARSGEWDGPLPPTSEIALHVGLLRAMPDVSAVVHTHSRYAAAFSVARLGLPFICNESIATRAERVMVTDYAPPGSGDLAAQALTTFRAQPGSRAVLLANHGVVAIGPTLGDAYVVAQSVEWTAEICHLARTLLAAGAGEHVLDRQVRDSIARNYGVTIAEPD